MYRSFFFWSTFIMVAFVGIPSALAQGANWPDLDSFQFERGPGNYLSPVKLGLCWALFLLWVKTTDWVSQDCQRLRISYVTWTAVVFFTFLVGFFLIVLMIPNFLIGYPLYLLTYAVPIGVYVVYRNKQVEPHLKVLTPSHIRHLLVATVNQIGIKLDAEKKASYEMGPPVEITPRGGETDRDNTANLLTARQSPGFVILKEVIADTVDRRGDKVMLDYTTESVAIRFQIDGVWHEGEPRDLESGEAALWVTKTLSALNAKERMARQSGEIGVTYQGNKYTCAITCQGTKTGERMILELLVHDVPFQTFEELGMREKMQTQLMEILEGRLGFVLISSMPSGGLTTLSTVVLKSMDRYMRDFISIQDQNLDDPVVENVDIEIYDTGKEETPDVILPKLIRKQPNVLIMRDLVNAETINIVTEQALTEMLILAPMQASEAADALLRVLKKKPSTEEFSKAITAVLNQRLVRKLCDNCKETYTPSSDLLKKLGIPPGRIKSFYRPPQEPEEVCPNCEGIGYKGRTSIFELLVVDQAMRPLLAKNPDLESLRKASRKAGNRTLQEEGILLVVRGTTSLPELMRVLKQ